MRGGGGVVAGEGEVTFCWRKGILIVKGCVESS